MNSATMTDDELGRYLVRLHKLGGKKTLGTALVGFGLALCDRWYGKLCYRLGNRLIERELRRMRPQNITKRVIPIR